MTRDAEASPELREVPGRFAAPGTVRGAAPVEPDFALCLTFTAWATSSERWTLRRLFGFFAGKLVSAIFVLGHDAAHNRLTPKPWLSRLLARFRFLPALHNYGLS